MPPLVLIASAFALGIAVREGLDLPLRGVAVAAALAAVGLGVAWRWRRAVGVASVAASLALGALAAAGAWPEAPEGLTGGAAWDVTARVVEAPERAWGQAHLLVALERVGREGMERAAAGRVWIALGGEPVEPLLPGDRVKLHARLAAPRGFVELESPDPRRRLAARGVVAVAGVGEPAAVVRLAGDEEVGLQRTVASWRLALLGRVRARLDGEARALVESLVLGERGDVSRELDDAFRVAGVSHVLSVSGLHLAIAAFLAFVALARLLAFVEPLARRVAVRRIAALVALPATALYTLLTGAAVATVRSCVVAWIWLGGAALGRAAQARVALAAAALGILVVSPLQLYDPSFQLSFAAAIGGVVLAPKWMRWAAPSLPKGKWSGRLARAVVGLIAASASAILATAPIAAWHFGQVAPAGLVANLVVVPLAELWVLPVGLAACGLSPIAPAAAERLLDGAGIGAAAMAHVTRWIASWAPQGRVPAPTAIEAIAWYVALGGVAAGGRRGLRVAAVALLGLALAIGARVAEPRLFPSLVADFLDVGQGDACLVRLPDGKRLLVDGGGSFNDTFDPGAQVIVPWLERHGVRRIDVVVLTHPHPDHANGLATVVERLEVGEVWTNGLENGLPGLSRLEAAAAKKNIPVVRPHPIEGGGARVEVLHPILGGEVRVEKRWSENDGSIVLRVTYGGKALLLTGDIERAAEARLAASGQDLEAAVVKAPHHGSRTSSTAALVDRTHAEVVVFSVGNGNRWGFPAESVQKRWAEAGATLWRTDRDGAVRVRIGPRGSIDVTSAR